MWSGTSLFPVSVALIKLHLRLASVRRLQFDSRLKCSKPTTALVGHVTRKLFSFYPIFRGRVGVGLCVYGWE